MPNCRFYTGYIMATFGSHLLEYDNLYILSS